MLTKKNSPVSKLRKIIQADSSNIPEYINPRRPDHKAIWETIQQVYQLINRLTTEHVLAKLTVLSISSQVKTYMDNIMEICSDDEFLQINLFQLINNCIEYYEAIAVSDELYEVAANLRNFREMDSENNYY